MGGILGKKVRDRWKREGLCTTCGHERDNETKLTCQKCLDRMKERYLYVKMQKQKRRDINGLHKWN